MTYIRCFPEGEIFMKRRTFLQIAGLGTAATFAPGIVKSAFAQTDAQTETVTLPVPNGVPNGWFFLLFGQGEGSAYRVQNGTVTLPWNRGSQATFGNFANAGSIRSATQWFKVENLTGLPSGGWTATIEQGRLVYGSQLAFDSVENFVDGRTFALVGPVEDNQALSSFRVWYEGGYAYLWLPSELNSVSFSGANGSRPTTGLPTSGPRGLVNVGQLLQQTVPVGVKAQGSTAVVVSAQSMGGNTWRFAVPQGQYFQWAYQSRQGTQLIAWSTVGAADIEPGSRVTVYDGNAPRPVGPFAYLAQ